MFSQELSSSFVLVSNFPEYNCSDTRAFFLIISVLVMIQLYEQQGKLSKKVNFYQKQQRKLGRATFPHVCHLSQILSSRKLQG